MASPLATLASVISCKIRPKRFWLTRYAFTHTHTMTCIRLICQFIAALTEAGIRQDDIAVITPYRQQIKLLTSVFADLPRVEILTADKSQGRDKDVIVISLVRSNESGNVSSFVVPSSPAGAWMVEIYTWRGLLMSRLASC
jgi:hypothetical protein